MTKKYLSATELTIPYEIDVASSEVRKGVSANGKAWERLKVITHHNAFEADENGKPTPVLGVCEFDSEIELPKGKHRVGMMVTCYVDKKKAQARVSFLIKKLLK